MAPRVVVLSLASDFGCQVQLSNMTDEILDVLMRHVVPKLKIEMANQQPGPRGMLNGQA